MNSHDLVTPGVLQVSEGIDPVTIGVIDTKKYILNRILNSIFILHFTTSTPHHFTPGLLEVSDRMTALTLLPFI